MLGGYSGRDLGRRAVHAASPPPSASTAALTAGKRSVSGRRAGMKPAPPPAPRSAGDRVAATSVAAPLGGGLVVAVSRASGPGARPGGGRRAIRAPHRGADDPGRKGRPRVAEPQPPQKTQGGA